MSAPLLVRNLSQIATPLGLTGKAGGEMGRISVQTGSVIVIDQGRFAYLGPEKEIPKELASAIERDVDAGGGTALPGFIDTHTHLPFAGFRESEFNRRLQGETYSDIAASGGGIASTVAATRAASEQELAGLTVARSQTMSLYGTTTAEVKSGYGLELDHELKQLRAIAAARPSSPVRLLSTCLAAHDIPPEARGSDAARSRWLDSIVEEILPAAAKQGLAQFCDVFVEKGVFTLEEGRRILERGKLLGLVPRIHADELSDTGGARLAAEVGAVSADHLMYVSEEGISELARSGCVANLLPGTSFFLMSSQFAPARKLIDRGAIVSLSTDCNPGSSMTESMQIVVQLASLLMRMTVEECLTAATLNGAHSLGLARELGSVETGKRADLVILAAPSYLHLVYHYGINLVTHVFRDGELVVEQGRGVSQ